VTGERGAMALVSCRQSVCPASDELGAGAGGSALERAVGARRGERVGVSLAVRERTGDEEIGMNIAANEAAV